MSKPNTPTLELESDLTSANEVAANYNAAQENTSQIFVDIGGVRDVSNTLIASKTADINTSEQPTIPQLLQTANLPENTPVVEYTNSYKSAAELVQALEQSVKDTKNESRPTTTSALVDKKLASPQVFIDKVNASIAERDNQPETFYLATVTVADLGFKNGATTQQIQDEIRIRRGIEFCKVEDAVIDHINDKDLTGLKSFMLDGQDIANDTLSDSDGRPRVFSRDGGDDGRRLNADCPRARLHWAAGRRVVLRLSKSDSDA